MRSERRHELQHNVLLDWLMQTGEKIKPQLNAILLGLVLVLLVFMGYRWMSTQSANAEAAAWDSVFLAMNQNDTIGLDQAIEEYDGTTAAQWAAVIAGDRLLAMGCDELFTTKATAVGQFGKAQDKYKDVLNNSPERVIRERATYGLARTHEAMAGTRPSQGDLKEAIIQYKAVVDGWPDGAYSKAAQARLDALSQTSTLEFYDALAVWTPRPAGTSPGGLDGLNLPFDQPGTGLDVGETPKDFFGDITDKIDDSMEAPAAEEPADGTEQAPPEAPAMPAASGDKPAENADKPAAEADKPAAEADKPTAEEGSE